LVWHMDMSAQFQHLSSCTGVDCSSSGEHF
jgi:hypothetical protein